MSRGRWLMTEMKACGPKVYESIKRKVTDLADTDGEGGGGGGGRRWWKKKKK